MYVIDSGWKLSKSVMSEDVVIPFLLLSPNKLYLYVWKTIYIEVIYIYHSWAQE